jgi:hypothetical protein
MQPLRRHISFANVTSALALFVALGGTAVAAVALAPNSVGTAELKNNAVTSPKVKNHTLKAADFKPGVLQSGPQGPQGPAGADATVAAFARIGSDGVLVGGTSQNRGVTAAMVQKDAGAPAAESTGPGVYCLGGLGFTPTSAIVVLDNTDSLPAPPAVQGGSLNFIASVAVFKGEDLGHCNATHGSVRVAIERVDQTNPPELVDHGFFIWLQK